MAGNKENDVSEIGDFDFRYPIFTCVTETRNSKLFTPLWDPGTHRPWFLWVPKGRKWVPSLVILLIRNIKMRLQAAGG